MNILHGQVNNLSTKLEELLVAMPENEGGGEVDSEKA